LATKLKYRGCALLTVAGISGLLALLTFYAMAADALRAQVTGLILRRRQFFTICALTEMAAHLFTKLASPTARSPKGSLAGIWI
jgi:hypothetical protein